jgi:dUTP pyrophosphatase
MLDYIPIKRSPNGLHLPLPEYATPGSAGLDLMAAIVHPLCLRPLERWLVPTGFCLELPQGYEAQIRPRSGLALKHGITCLNSPGTIDSDYRGQVHALLINLGTENFTIEPGMRIAQMVIAKFERIGWKELEKLDTSLRGEGGFGSTGE